HQDHEEERERLSRLTGRHCFLIRVGRSADASHDSFGVSADCWGATSLREPETTGRTSDIVALGLMHGYVKARLRLGPSGCIRNVWKADVCDPCTIERRALHQGIG